MKMLSEGEKRDNLYPGHMACAGCGEVLGLKLVLQAVGEKAMAVLLPSCLGVILGPFPYTTFKIPVFHAAFETAASSAAGISNALLAKGDEETHVVALAGDGGTADIGVQALSGAADRNENIIYCCFDNEAYMNTGIQSSSLTPRLAWTMTTPLGRPLKKKNMVEIMGAHKIPYAASACSCFPDDLRRKISEAKKLKGMKYIHILSPCPTGWRFPERLTPNIGRLAVETNYFPLYEIRNGQEYTITHHPRNLPVEEYLLAQGRFKHLTKKDLERIQKEVDDTWDELVIREGKGCSA
ncbi:MAG: pyruvate synthase subunit beta [Proteobacteria bacterium]|nr:pyruvate synthase subunit beta [Pseudomonadota bacterium]